MIRLLKRLKDPDDDLVQALLAASRADPDLAAMAATYLRNE